MFEREEGLRSNLVAKFKLCPNNSCRSCHNGGEYIVEMREFVETYQEALKESQEYECETAKEACEYSCENGGYQYNYQNYDANGGNYNANYNYNNNGNNNQNDDEYCLNTCLADKGMDYCQDEQDGEGDRDMNEFAECQPMNDEEGGNNNNNGNYNYQTNYQMYYVGAYCTSSGVYAGVFTDSTCTKHAPKGTYEKYNYGYSLPTQPLVSSTCMSCEANNYDNDGNNNNNNNGGGISEVCMGLYEEAVKCESRVKTTYKDTSGCEMIHNVIPKLSKAMKGIRGPSTALVFAWLFGIGFFALAGYLYTLHKKVGLKKTTVTTADADYYVQS
jgi:hypothetical protein